MKRLLKVTLQKKIYRRSSFVLPHLTTHKRYTFVMLFYSTVSRVRQSQKYIAEVFSRELTNTAINRNHKMNLTIYKYKKNN